MSRSRSSPRPNERSPEVEKQTDEHKLRARRGLSSQSRALAIVSDIHGNLTALEAVVADIERRHVGRVLQGGDLALAGCQPAEVIDLVRELGWEGIVGN